MLAGKYGRHLPNEVWYMILSYGRPLDHWRTTRCVNRHFKALVEEIFRKAYQSLIRKMVIVILCPGQLLQFRVHRLDHGKAYFRLWGSGGPSGAASHKLLSALVNNLHSLEEYQLTRMDMSRCEGIMKRNNNSIDPRMLSFSEASQAHRQYRQPVPYWVHLSDGHGGPFSHRQMPLIGLEVFEDELRVDWMVMLEAFILKRQTVRLRHDQMTPERVGYSGRFDLEADYLTGSVDREMLFGKTVRGI